MRQDAARARIQVPGFAADSLSVERDSHIHDPEQALDPERRQSEDRRSFARGGRRREDRPEDAGVIRCPWCSGERVTLTEVGAAHYDWNCQECGRDFESRRASRMAL